MGINKVLMSGHLQFDNDERRLTIVDSMGCIKHSLKYDEIKASDWGYIYERHVGLYFEAAGYSVSYRGATLGFFDGGIDLVIEKGPFKQFIQCKYGTSPRLNKQNIEVLLYKASSFLTKEYNGKKLHFGLAIPGISQMFTKRRMKKHLGEKSIFPLADYFLSKNKVQDKVKLEIIEVPMNISFRSIPEESGLRHHHFF